MSIGNFLEQIFLMTIGMSSFIGIYGFILYRNSWRWRQLSAFYAASSHEKPIKQRWTNMIIHGAGAWNSYAGVTLVGVNERGITLKILPPFSFFHCPLFIPFNEVNLMPTRWLFQDAYEIKLRHDTGLHVVINVKTALWIENQTLALDRLSRDYDFKIRSELG